MYTLRRIASTGVEMNHYLGKAYTVVDKEKSPEQFERDYQLLMESTWEMPLNHDQPRVREPENVYALVGNEDGSKIFCLYNNQKAYILAPNGSTVSNLTQK